MERTLLIILFCMLVSFAQVTPGGGEPWKAPPEADLLKDPMAGDAKAAVRGGKVFHALCWVCHGMQGRGDGPSAPSLRARPADLGDAGVQAQSNGALYWKITHGRGEMASYEQVLSREERWAVVHYLRTLEHP